MAGPSAAGPARRRARRSGKGLGFFIAVSISTFRIPTAFAGLVVLVATSLGVFRLMGWLQHRPALGSLPASER